MLDILVMDDVLDKTRAIGQILLEECNIPENHIDIAKTIAEGRSKMREKYYDLVLLDLVMPLRKDEPANHEEAPKFIDEIYENPDIKEPCQIIGITAFDDEFEELKVRYDDKLWNLIKYSESDCTWKSQIKRKVFHLKSMKEHLKASLTQKTHFDIGIICALPEEFHLMLEAFGKDKWRNCQINGLDYSIKCRKITTGNSNEFSVCALCVGKPGMVATTSAAISLYNLAGVDTIFMTGIAAGFKSDSLHLGDVVVAQSSLDYSCGKLLDDEAENNKRIKQIREIQQIQGPDSLLSIVNSMSEDHELTSRINNTLCDKHLGSDRGIKIHVGATACGPYVVGSQQAVESIKTIDRKFRALDMEGYGLYYAAHSCGKRALWIKGISDFADEHKDDSYHNKASFASAYFLYLMIKEMM